MNHGTSRRFPMAREQESVWLNDQLHDGVSRYLESWVHRLHGPLDPRAVETALTGIVARHEVLRTALEMDAKGRPLQRVLPAGRIRLAEQEVATRDLDAVLRGLLRQPLPLDQPPLLRAHLLHLGPQDAVLAVALHHAVVDGWSLRLLDTEFSELYRAAVAARPPRLDPLPLQVGEYALRQRSVADRDDQLAYWRETLKDVPAESSLPGDRPRPAVFGPAGGQLEFTLDAALTDQVARIARERRTTPFAVLLSALTALTVRLAGQEDVVLGTPVSARRDEETEALIGCLTDVLPIRQRVRPGTSFHQLLDATGDTVWDVLDHHEVSLRQLIAELGVERSLARFPLFQIVFTMDDGALEGPELPGITAERLLVPGGTAKYDLFLAMVPEGDGMRGILEYSVDLYDDTTAHNLVERYRTLLADALARPDADLWELAVMPERELRLVTDDWAGHDSCDAAPSSVLDLVEAQVRQRPDAVAVVSGDRRLTYAELDQAAGRLTARLLDGGWSGQRVAIRMERSPELLVAVLGVLGAGCVYVPLDAAYPQERTDFVLADSGASLLISDQPSRWNGELLRLSEVLSLPEEPLEPRGPRAAVARTVRPDAEDLAYVVYTSGSTGRPKGVAMPHGPLANLIVWQCGSSDCGPGSRTLQFAPLSFDVSFQEIFSTWAAGGAVVVAPETARRDPEQLLDLVERQRVDRLFLPYVALQQLAQYAEASGRGCPTLREVVSSGEQLYVTPAIRSFFSHATTASLENQYGPSETHVVAAERLQGPASEWPERPSIGRPIDGVRIRLLDAELRPVPPGTVGEIHVGGRAPALGYLGRPEATAQAFPPDPFVRGGRMYRTGDKGRHLSDGRIEYLGRGDGQVKIRGYRVETAEVESAVKGVPGVFDAVVLVEEDPAVGGRSLVGYYVCAGADADPGAGAGSLSAADLRTALLQRLPEYSVPQRLVTVRRIPVTPSGKADRAALRRLALASDPWAGRGRTRPTEYEGTARQVAELWREVLGRVGAATDDFFAMGGDSLLAVKLVLAIRARLDVQLPMNAVYLTPTVAGLAAAVDGLEQLTEQTHGDPAAEVLPEEIRPAATVVAVATEPAEVLLTGATGFLGAFVLRELVDRTSARVHCLVRGESPEHARARLCQTMDWYGLWDGRVDAAATVVPGDLGLPRLGLTAAQFDALARDVDAVYHVGAAVNLAQTYAQARAANVLGTAEVLRLAASVRTVPVHHVSTVGVFAGGEIHGRTIGADHPLPSVDLLVHGYTRSKWAAEQLVEQARHRGLPVSVYRPTRVVGHSDTGACQSRDFVWLLLRGCVEAGAAPDLGDTAFDLVPVDHVSRTLVALSRAADAAGGRFHLAADRALRFDRLVDLVRAEGYALTTVPVDEWLGLVRADPGNPAFPMLGVLAGIEADEDPEGSARFDTSTTSAVLPGPAFRSPRFDRDAVRAHLGYFTRTGAWPLPRT